MSTGGALILFFMVMSGVFLVCTVIAGIRKKRAATTACLILLIVNLCFVIGGAIGESMEDEATSEETSESSAESVEQETNEVFAADEFYSVGAEYIGQEVTVSGTIQEISEFSDMNGYYLYGTTGQGLVVWIYESEKSHAVGDVVTLTGTVQNAGDGQVEIVVNAPETEVSADAEVILMQIAEDTAAQIAQNPSTVSFSTFEWGFAREGDTYAVQGTFSCSNAYGVSENHVLQVWCETNEDQSKITPYRVVLDGSDLKVNN